jgi:hypothetical protein
MSHASVKVFNESGSTIEALLPGLDKPYKIPPSGDQSSVEGADGRYEVTTEEKKNIVQGKYSPERPVAIRVKENVVSSQT